MSVLEMKKEAKSLLCGKDNRILMFVAIFSVILTILLLIGKLIFSKMVSVVPILIFAFFFFFLLNFYLYAVTIFVNLKKYGKKVVVSSIKNNYGKMIRMSIRLVLKNYLIFAVVAVAIYGASYLDYKNYGTILQVIIWTMYGLYFLRMMLDFFVSSYITCYSDGMKFKEVRAEVLEVLSEKKFFTLIYSHYEVALLILAIVFFKFIPYFIWKPNFVMTDMVGTLPGSNFYMQDMSPVWWSILSTFLLSFFAAYVMMLLLSAILVYYEHTMYLTDKEIRQTDKKYFGMKIGLKLGYLLLIVAAINSQGMFEKMLGRVYQAELKKEREMFFESLPMDESVIMEGVSGEELSGEEESIE